MQKQYTDPLISSKIWAIADLHLAISNPEKDMGLIAPNWKGYMEKIAHNWKERVEDEDLVLIAGDISWAMRPHDAEKDLHWIEHLPGMKIIIRGNHDYWWSSFSKVKKILPPSIQALQHTAISWNEISISGTRLWDRIDDDKIFEREMGRLELACKALDQNASKRIIMTHYPPIDDDLTESRPSFLLEKYRVDILLFGHIHGADPKLTFGARGGIRYILTSADHLDFCPIQII